MNKKKIEDALNELHFIDEPELDINLISKSVSVGCVKHCTGGHCGGQTEGCPRQRMCDDKCLGLGGCVKQSGKWCSNQNPECDDKGQCANKCLARGVSF